MAQPPSQPPQNHQLFLSTVLSQRGPSSLPYTEDVKWLIRQHLISLSEAYPSMTPKTAVFTHNDGRSVNLLQSDGTLPMVYQNVTYNIPVVIWLMESYPRYAPSVYVNPTRDMVVKRGHAFVNPNGLVVVSYLQNWVYPSSNLVDLCRNLSHYFGLDPPLYSNRRPNPSPSVSVNPNPSVSINQNPSFNSNPSFGNASVRPAIPPRSYPPSPYGGGRVSPNLSSNSLSSVGVTATEDPAEVYRRNVINKLVESVHGDVEELRKKREVEMEGMLSAQNVLRIREEEVNKGLREMTGEKEGLEQQLQMVLMNTDVLEAWVKENEGKLTTGGGVEGVSGDEVFEPADRLSKQMLECTAADLAIEDVIYALDKAVQEGAIAVDVYLKNVRLLSREQFVHRALSMKVRAAQMQAQVTSMASRAPPYAV